MVKQLKTEEKIVLIFVLGLFEEGINNACGLGFNHFDGEKREFVLPIRIVLLGGSNRDEINDL